MSPANPSQGAGRREGLLLAAFAVLTLVGLWTVVVAELADDTAPTPAGQSVTVTTEKTSPDTQ